MPLLVFVLECAAVAVWTGTLVSLLGLGAFLLLGPFLGRLAPSRRANCIFAIGVSPAMVSIAVVLGAAAPSVLAALGFAHDHCNSHGHHVHLCIVHSGGLRPFVAATGAFGLAAFVLRSVALVRSVVAMNRRLARLESLGVRCGGKFPVISVPGQPVLCHATGIIRRRVLFSAELANRIPQAELRAALAHEEAHLLRHDPLSLTELSVAGLFAVPAIARFLRLRFQDGIEEACDAEAAVAVADAPLVAMALINVANLQRLDLDWSSTAPAFGRGALERRVHLLLGEPPLAVVRARALSIGFASAGLSLAATFTLAPDLHHAVETALHYFF